MESISSVSPKWSRKSVFINAVVLGSRITSADDVDPNVLDQERREQQMLQQIRAEHIYDSPTLRIQQIWHERILAVEGEGA